MNASRQDMRRAIDFSAVKDPESITHAIQALVMRRANPMRAKEIMDWFRATPAPFVVQALDKMVERGQIKIVNRNRCVLTYWADGRDE